MSKKTSAFIFAAALLFAFDMGLRAQDSIRPFQISAYLETYYCYDAAEPSDHVRSPVFFNYKRHNEFNLNLGFIKANYNSEKVRGNFALMAGTYSEYNLASEGGLKNIFEANAGFKIGKKSNSWIDAGIFPSHIGFESALGSDCWNLSRSMLAENSPYYETGLRFSSTTANSKLYGALFLLNGWQNIRRSAANQTPAFGSQLSFQANKNTFLNWSSFVGNVYPDTAAKWRIFNNFYTRFVSAKKFGVIMGFDLGFEQDKKASSTFNTWYAPVLILQYAFSDKWKLGARAEYYDDRNKVIINISNLPFQTAGYSVNLDFLPQSNIQLRTEFRILNSSEKVLQLAKKPSALNYFGTCALIIFLKN